MRAAPGATAKARTPGLPRVRTLGDSGFATRGTVRVGGGAVSRAMAASPSRLTGT